MQSSSPCSSIVLGRQEVGALARSGGLTSVEGKRGLRIICFSFRGLVSWRTPSSVTKKLRSFAMLLEGGGANLNADKRKVLDQLIVKGFVVAADEELPAKYKLTAKAQQLLAERGVGLSGG